MDEQTRLKQQMAEIGTRYLRRTIGEMPRLRELHALLPTSDPAVLREVEHLAHKIHGTGAMFGFHALSDAAGELERLAAPRATCDAEYLARIGVVIDRVQQEVQGAAQARGIG